MKPKKLLVFAISLAAVVVFATVVSLPLAGDDGWNKVKGTYFSIGDNACLVSAPSSSPPTSPFVPASVQSSSVQGTLKIKADGTGSGQFKELILTNPPASNAGESSSEYSVTFTYTIADDGIVTVTFTSVSGKVLPAGPPFTLAAPQLTGQITPDKSTMLLSSAGPAIEILIVETSSTTSLYFERECHRTRTLVRVHTDEDDKD